jgi:hypothetical protein
MEMLILLVGIIAILLPVMLIIVSIDETVTYRRDCQLLEETYQPKVKPTVLDRWRDQSIGSKPRYRALQRTAHR